MDQADIISAVEFNHDGELLATGDKGGRVVVFQKSRDDPSTRLCGDYNFYATFQSHEPEFDYLKSLEIEEKINEIQWLKQRNASRFLLTTNGRDFPDLSCFQGSASAVLVYCIASGQLICFSSDMEKSFSFCLCSFPSVCLPPC